MKRLLSLLLVAILILPCLLAGCNGNDAVEETTKRTPPQSTIIGDPNPEESNNDNPEDTTLPEEPIKEPLELTSVTIVGGNTPAEQTAVSELGKYLEQKGVSVGENGFPITVLIDSSLGDDAYLVTATVGEGKDEGLIIAGGNGRGVLYGVYGFLERYANVRFFTPDLEVCEPGDVIIDDGILLEHTPVFELRQTDWYRWMPEDSRHDWATKNGINLISGWNSTWGEELGGSLGYAPGLFVHTIGKLAELKVDYPATAPNPCLTDETVYNTVLANVRKTLEQYPDSKIVSISQNDNTTYCKCENCSAIVAEEGSQAGLFLRFVNRIAEELAPDYPDLTIDTLAYRDTLQAPKITKPAPNVCVRLCTITCHFNHAITKYDCSACTNFRNAIKKWSAICENIYIWDYTTNYAYYLSPFPNFHVLRENMQFFAKHNVKGVYEQGNASSPSGEFGELRAYLIAKLLMNPYMSKEEYDTHMKEFLAAYYGAGWESILAYIDALTMCAKVSSAGMGIYSHPLTVISQSGVATMKDTFNGYWDTAEALAGDRLEYVQRSRWQLRYLLLFVEPNREDAEQLIQDVEGNGTHWSEQFDVLLWYVYDERFSLLDQYPNTWFTDPSKK